jgi:hypothetical protein
MIKRCTINDLEFVNYILTDDSVYPYISEDNTSEDIKNKMAEIYLSTPLIYVLSPNKYSIFIYIPMTSIMYEIHSNVLPDGRGKAALKALNESMEWIFENTICRKIISWIPMCNRLALTFAINSGAKKQGHITKSFVKYGELHDQLIYGITQEEWICQQQSQ